MPPELDSRIEAAAAAEGTSYSGWLAAVARKEFTIREDSTQSLDSSDRTDASPPTSLPKLRPGPMKPWRVRSVRGRASGGRPDGRHVRRGSAGRR